MNREEALKKSGEIRSEFSKEMDKIQGVLKELDISFCKLQEICTEHKTLLTTHETNPPKH